PIGMEAGNDDDYYLVGSYGPYGSYGAYHSRFWMHTQFGERDHIYGYTAFDARGATGSPLGSFGISRQDGIVDWDDEYGRRDVGISYSAEYDTGIPSLLEVKDPYNISYFGFEDGNLTS